MKDIKKSIISTSQHIKGIKVIKSSTENYNTCFSIYQEGSCYFYQCCGFLKSQYIEGSISPSSKSFFINNLYLPAYKKFLELRQYLALLEVDDIYKSSLEGLKESIESINNSLYEILNQIADA
jgi:hypothetical protein